MCNCQKLCRNRNYVKSTKNVMTEQDIKTEKKGQTKQHITMLLKLKAMS